MDLTEHNRKQLLQLKVGDLVEFKRGVYSHWAVYKGDEEVIHLTGEDGDGIASLAHDSFQIGGKLFSKAFVKVDNFWDVVADCKAYRNNSRDRKFRALPADEIISRAMSKIGEVDYNIIFSNCEHFASWCRYNIEQSEQVTSFVTGFLVGVVAIAAAGMAVFFKSSDSRKSREKEESSKQHST